MSTSLSKIDPERSQAIPARGIKPLAVYIVPKPEKSTGNEMDQRFSTVGEYCKKAQMETAVTEWSEAAPKGSEI